MIGSASDSGAAFLAAPPADLRFFDGAPTSEPFIGASLAASSCAVSHRPCRVVRHSAVLAAIDPTVLKMTALKHCRFFLPQVTVDDRKSLLFFLNWVSYLLSYKCDHHYLFLRRSAVFVAPTAIHNTTFALDIDQKFNVAFLVWGDASQSLEPPAAAALP